MPERSLPDKFLVAFSFAGEQRDLVRSIAEEVEKRFGPGKVFLDEWYEHYIAGDNADQTLQDIYRKRSELVVFCISKPYGNKPWSKVEFEAIRALKMQISLSTAKSDRLRILPLRVGDGDVEGISFNTICPDAREKPVAQTAELIINRLRLIRRDLDTRQLTPLEFEPFLFEKRKDFTGRTWVFEAIALWLTDQTERALLIYGSPGAGKSALVAALVNGTMSRQVLAYHCCQINEPNTLDAAMFVRSLAAMIAKRLPVYSKLVEDPIVEALEGRKQTLLALSSVRFSARSTTSRRQMPDIVVY